MSCLSIIDRKFPIKIIPISFRWTICSQQAITNDNVYKWEWGRFHRAGNIYHQFHYRTHCRFHCPHCFRHRYRHYYNGFHLFFFDVTIVNNIYISSLCYHGMFHNKATFVHDISMTKVSNPLSVFPWILFQGNTIVWYILAIHMDTMVAICIAWELG